MPPFHGRPTGSGQADAAQAPLAARWREGLPVFADALLTLREVEADDAVSLVAHVATEAVSRFISPPPGSIDQFERFIRWSRAQREAGQSACYGIVPAGASRAVGLFQLRSREAGFLRAEWGFALGSAYWGTGMFAAGAAHVLEFAFRGLGVMRLEARAAVIDGRGNAALRKVGAVQEGVLRQSLLCQGRHHDQVLWAMLADEWHRRHGPHRPRVH